VAGYGSIGWRRTCRRRASRPAHQCLLPGRGSWRCSGSGVARDAGGAGEPSDRERRRGRCGGRRHSRPGGDHLISASMVVQVIGRTPRAHAARRSASSSPTVRDTAWNAPEWRAPERRRPGKCRALIRWARRVRTCDLSRVKHGVRGAARSRNACKSGEPVAPLNARHWAWYGPVRLGWPNE
jgi:hypothetical protein